MSDSPIYVTRPFLPPLEEFLPLLEQIWSSRILTNQGPFHQQFESELRDFLDVPNVSLVTNGMLALDTALEAAEVEGEVVTTPFSFVATAHAIKRRGLTPVFVDIRPSDLNIDPTLIEQAITPQTSAILAVHCYGCPCRVFELQEIADRHGLRLIYDAAHAIGVKLDGKGLLSFGDFSAASFHATKTFNTFEGGAVAARELAGKRRIDELRNFGILDEVTVGRIGGNAKMSEFNAALGLVQLRYVEEIRAQRAEIDRRYRSALAEMPGLDFFEQEPAVTPNHGYFPIFVRDDYGESRDGLYERLKMIGVFSRRYFYPLLADLPMYRDLPSARELPIARQAAEQVLCLPIYPGLSTSDQDRIIEALDRR